MSGSLALLRKAELFAGCSEDALSRAARASETRLTDAGSIIVRAESPVTAIVFLARGKVALYRRNPERDVTLLLGLLEAPSLFGDAEAMTGQPWIVNARAEEETLTVHIPVAAFVRLIESDAALSVRLYRDACVRHLLANQTAQVMALHSIETQLLRVLLEYAHRFGEVDGGSAVIRRPTTIADLAAALGVNRKTVTRTLAPLAKQGVVLRTDDGQWQLKDPRSWVDRLPRSLLGLSSRTGEQPAPMRRPRKS